MSAVAFLEHGFEELPSSEVLTPLVSPQLYLWESDDDSTPMKAVLKAYPQTLSCVADMSHITILGIKLLTAEYSGDVCVESLPESKKLYLQFILHDNAAISRFKITYEN